MPYFSTIVDLAPTFLAIAGLSKPAVMDGRSLLPLLLSEGAEASYKLQVTTYNFTSYNLRLTTYK